MTPIKDLDKYKKQLIAATRKRNKKIKPDDLKRCENFGTKKYIPQLNHYDKLSAKKYKFTYSKPSSKNQQLIYKRSFCNPECDSFENYDVGEIKNGFRTAYTRKQIKQMKKQGALSACMHDNLSFDADGKLRKIKN